MKRIVLLAGIIACVVLAFSAQGAPLRYTVGGELQNMGGFDDRSLNGARFAYSFTADPEFLYSVGGSCCGGLTKSEGYWGLQSDVTLALSDRPSGADVTFSIHSPGSPHSAFVTVNMEAVGISDLFEIRGGLLDVATGSPWYGFEVGRFSFNLGAEYWEYAPGASHLTQYGEMPPLEDIISSFGAIWDNNPLGNANANYLPVNVSITAEPVPLPATVWLFGSALGLLGWRQRKTAEPFSM